MRQRPSNENGLVVSETTKPLSQARSQAFSSTVP
jgi:hypothetical protein